MELAAALRALEGSIESALFELSVPCYLLDREGTILWLNSAAVEALGRNAVGRKFVGLVAPEDVHAAREIFARKLLGRAGPTEFTLRVLDSSGRRVTIEIHSVPIRGRGAVVGVFGFARPLEVRDVPGNGSLPALTPRQHEILRLLDHGLATGQIAKQLGLSEETVRNHIRGVLQSLEAHSRLEAVAVARRRGLLP